MVAGSHTELNIYISWKELDFPTQELLLPYSTKNPASESGISNRQGRRFEP